MSSLRAVGSAFRDPIAPKRGRQGRGFLQPVNQRVRLWAAGYTAWAMAAQLSTVTLLAALAASPLVAAPKADCSIRPPKSSAKADLPGLARVTQADAQKAAVASKDIPAGASVAEAELEVEHGCLVWSFDLKLPDKPGVQEVQIDAGNGNVLFSAYESPKKEAAEKAKDGAAARKRSP